MSTEWTEWDRRGARRPPPPCPLHPLVQPETLPGQRPGSLGLFEEEAGEWCGSCLVGVLIHGGWKGRGDSLFIFWLCATHMESVFSFGMGD